MKNELDLTALRKIAEAATPGPWEAKPYLYGVDDDGRIRVTSPSDSGSYNLAESVLPNEAKHIATFDPQTVLALPDRIEQAERELKSERVLTAAASVIVHDAREAALRHKTGVHPDSLQMAKEDVAEEVLRALDGDGRA